MSSSQNPRGPENDAALEERRRTLSGQLSDVRAPEARNKAQAEFSRDASGLAQAMRLSTEFVAGVVAGSALGWLIDYFVGSSPWGLIVFTLLGFAAGIMNMMRAAGLLPRFGQRK